MRSCQNLMLELCEKLNLAEEHLKSEKFNLHKIDELFTQEKERWMKELKSEQLKVYLKEKEIKNKEVRLEELKKKYNEVLEKISSLEQEHEKLKKEIQKEKINFQKEENIYLLEQERLEEELMKIQKRKEELKSSTKWTKIYQIKELKDLEDDNDIKLREEIKLLSDGFSKKVEDFDENLKEIERTCLKPRLQKLKEMQETLAELTAKCEDMELKNKKISKEKSDFLKEKLEF